MNFFRISSKTFKHEPRFILLLLLVVVGVTLVFVSYIFLKSTGKTDIPPAKNIEATIQQVKRLICNLNARGFSNWVFIEQAEEIPHQKGDLKDPIDYAKQIQPPSLEKVDDHSLVTLYTWTENDGLLAKWTATVEGEKVTFLRGEVVDVAVGHYNPLPVEGRFLPGAGDLLVNESVNSLNIGDNSSCRGL